MTVAFLPQAEEELFAAAHYYETHSPELGVGFLHEVRLATDALSHNPQAAPVIKYGIRRRTPQAISFWPSVCHRTDHHCDPGCHAPATTPWLLGGPIAR
jgi:hypothetical protein